MADRFREALIEYMTSVLLCDGGDYLGPDGILEPLTKEETDELIKEVEKRSDKYLVEINS